MDTTRKKGRGKKPSPLDIEQIFEGRVVIEGEIYDALVSEITDEWGNEVYDLNTGELAQSSYPHLTHKSETRGAHITSSRIVREPVSDDDPYIIHQRFHQDADGASEPTHDRYFAVNKKTGTVHAVRVDFIPEVHIGKNETVPMRGATLAQTSKTVMKLRFTVGDEDDKHPPLSPRSARRQVPDQGY